MLFAEITIESFLPAMAAFLAVAIPVWKGWRDQRLKEQAANNHAQRIERDTQIAGLKDLIDSYRQENNALRERMAVMEAAREKDEQKLQSEIDLLMDYVRHLKREVAEISPEVKWTTFDEFRSTQARRYTDVPVRS
jgi:predicted RNase H-like nuclease (RuvC/YqgF family)